MTYTPYRRNSISAGCRILSSAIPPLAAAVLLISATAATALEFPDWSSEHYRDHPLVGSVWRGDGTETRLDTVVRAAREADFVLIGETHPNPDHHVLQADIIRTLRDDGRRPAVVFEMIPAGLQSVLDAHVREHPGDAAGLGARLDWEARGWPAWQIYQPIAEAALGGGLPMKAGDLDRDLIKRIGGQGVAALKPGQSARLGLDRPLAADLETELLAALRESHCNLLPEAMLAPMLTVQRARDGALAAAMIEAGGDGAVLIAGAGHVRSDWAVPAILGDMAPNTRTVSIALIEVEQGLDTFADYVAESENPLAPYDFVIFTPRSEVTDHCAELGERFANPDRAD